MASNINNAPKDQLVPLAINQTTLAPLHAVPLEIKTEEISRSIFQQLDFSQSQAAHIDDYHLKITAAKQLTSTQPQIISGQIKDYHIKANATFIKSKKSKATSKAPSSQALISKNIAKALMESAISTLEQAVGQRDKLAKPHSDYLNSSAQMVKHIKQCSTYEQALAFAQPIAKQLNSKKIPAANQNIDTLRKEVISHLSTGVKSSLISKEEALTKYKSLLGTIYTKNAFVEAKTTQTLQKLTTAIAEKDPNLTEEKLEQLENMKEMLVDDLDIEEEAASVGTEKSKKLNEFRAHLNTI